MNLFLFDKHSDLESPVHRQDPLVKLLSFLVFVTTVVLLPKDASIPLAVATVTLALAAVVSRVPLGFLLRRTLTVAPFVLLIGAVNLLGRGLDLVPSWFRGASFGWVGGIPSVKTGADASALASFGMMAAKSLLSVFGFGLLLSTTGSAKLLAAARRAGLPVLLVVATGFMLRYVFVLADELSRLRRSWEARRVGRLQWLTELRYIGSLIGVLLVKSCERAERVYLAMCSRGFDGVAAPEGEIPSSATVRLSAASLAFPLLLVGPVLTALLLRF